MVMPQNKIFAKLIKASRPAEFTNTIVFSVDATYLPYAIFVANQILSKEPDLALDICICLPDLSAVPENFIASKIRFIEIAIEGLEILPVGKLSLSAYHRLFLPELLAADYQYLIYLDADTYILRPFSEEALKIIDSFDESFCVAAAMDICELQIETVDKNKLNKVQTYVSQYHKHGHIYRNSGVLIFNVKNYLEKDCRNKIIAYAFDHIQYLQCHDQSALNGALLKEIALLPFSFNWQVHKLTYNSLDEYKPYILHFIGENKPWSLINHLTYSYYNDYLEFFNSHYQTVNLDILSQYDRRLQQPKYGNKVKETISRESQRLKQKLLLKHTTPHRHLNKIKTSLAEKGLV